MLGKIKASSMCLIGASIIIGGAAMATNNITHVTYYVNFGSFSGSDFGNPIPTIDRAAKFWLSEAGGTTSLDDSGDIKDTGCGFYSPNHVFGVNGCEDDGDCSVMGSYYGCDLGGWVVEIDQIQNARWTLQPSTNSLTAKKYLFSLAAHEFGHALGLEHSSNEDRCTMGTDVNSVDTNMMMAPCNEDINALRSIQGTVQSNSTFNLVASSSSSWPVAGTSGFSLFVNNPGWSNGFADFTRPGNLGSVNPFFGEVLGNTSDNWISFNGGSNQSSLFTPDPSLVRPSVVLANNLLWAFWREDGNADDSFIRYATSPDNVTWTDRGLVTDGSGHFLRTRFPAVASFDPRANEVYLAVTVWDADFPLTPTSCGAGQPWGCNCPSTGCTTEITVMRKSATTPSGWWSPPLRIWQTAVGPPAMFCATSPTETSFSQCQFVWSGTDAARSLWTNSVKFYNDGSVSSSGSTQLDGFVTDFAPSVDGDISVSGSYGVVLGMTGLDGKLQMKQKSCSPDCGAFGSWFVPSSMPNPGELGPIIKSDPVGHFYRIYTAN